MFRAAQYAMFHNAPLLFTPQPTKQLDNAAVRRWNAAKPKGSNLPNISTIENNSRSESCDNLVGVSGLSTLKASNQLFQLPRQVAVRGNLAPVAVFAASKGPHDPPDVAVGLALAAHLARAAHTPTTGPQVSLVVVPPRYLEADPQLETQLRDQRGLVQGGVVLGSTHILSEDTRTLLRQILTSTDKQGVLGEIRTNLGLVQPLMAALLALLGLGAAAAVAPELGKDIVEYGQRINKPKSIYAGPDVVEYGQGTKKPESISGKGPVVTETKPGTPPGGETTAEQAPAVENEWLPALGDARRGDRPVTVWLRTGRVVTGKVDGERSTARVLRLYDAGQLEPKPGYRADFLLVLFDDIELIGANVQPEGGRRSRWP
jgi:hypothetical protein